MLRLRTFGGLSLEKENARLDDLASQRKALALLAILARSGESGIGREKLMTLLWPESDMERARGALKQMLHTIRRQLAAPDVIVGTSELSLDSSLIATDVGEFADHLKRHELEAAVDLYHGPFLDGVHIDKASEFSRWQDAERDALHRDYLGALEKLARASESEGRIHDALVWWRRYSAADPLDSRGAVGLMTALDAAGDRTGALRHAQNHQALLKSELDANPNADVSALADKLRASTGTPRMQMHITDAPAAGTRDLGDVPTHRFPKLRIALISAAALVAVVAGGTMISASYRGSTRNAVSTNASPAHTIAVLPFTNMSADRREEYFSDGLTDELIGTLSHVRALQVASRTSAFAFKGQNRDIRAIGRMLNVRTVLEGSVRKVGDRVRVTAQLINADDGYHLWSETFEREGPDIFAIQSDLALRITRALQTELTPEERERIVRPRTTNDVAHTYLMQARYFALQRRSGSLAKAIDYFRKAIEADPNYAEAYAGLASVYPPLGVRGYISSSEGRERMRAPAMKAVALDSSLAEAHTALGGYFYAFEWKWTDAEREFKTAIELDRSEAHGWYSVYLIAMHRFDEAVREARMGTVLAPLAAISFSQFAYTLVAAGRADLAMQPINTAIELDSGLSQPHWTLGLVYESAGKREESLREFNKAATLARGGAIETAYYGRALALAGKRDEALRILDSLKSSTSKTKIYTPQVALLFDAVGQRKAAIDWLEISAQQKHPGFPHGVAEPGFAALRRDPRFRALLKSNALPVN